ncbi:unnamed protein product [Onchocerca flexuosa]|uniref:Uncharacterized protein n=1 Tax=Onchocerca flexuosa TaxID=387005 RepID=A0A183HMU9_9BILA|nr:unnamed protein product [Onchocerca flexuosa]
MSKKVKNIENVKMMSMKSKLPTNMIRMKLQKQIQEVNVTDGKAIIRITRKKQSDERKVGAWRKIEDAVLVMKNSMI